MCVREVEANLTKLNEDYPLPFLGELVDRKLAMTEQSILADADVAFHDTQYERLKAELHLAYEASPVPESPSDESRTALNDLLVRVRLKHL